MDDKKLAALGNVKELLTLKSLGFSLVNCQSFKEAEEIISQLSSKKYELVIVAENILEGHQSAFLDLIKRFDLAILVLPQHNLPKNIAKEMIKKIKKEAVGL